MSRKQAFQQIIECLNKNKSFILEAGAGSGKTYSLIQTLNYVLEKLGAELEKSGQKIACITYTNVAKNEIIERVENSSLVVVSTIHEFLWDSIKNYQAQLHVELDQLNKQYEEERIDSKGKKKSKYKYLDNLLDQLKSVNIDYHDYPRNFQKGKIEHDDVILLSNNMFSNYPPLSNILAHKYPYIFIDEYQDTAPKTVQAIVDYHLLRNPKKVVLGFFGDSHQRIYDDGIGSLQSYSTILTEITKPENFRCSKAVIKVLNKVRTNIKQVPTGNNLQGSAIFIHTNSSSADISKSYSNTIEYLENQRGWDFTDAKKTKTLSLTHRSISGRLTFSSLYDAYSKRYGLSTTQKLFERDDIFASFFFGSKKNKDGFRPQDGIEHLVAFYNNKSYGEIISILRKKGFQLTQHEDKEVIDAKIKALIELRKTGTLEDVLNLLKKKNLVNIHQKIFDFEEFIQRGDYDSDEDRTKADKNKSFYQSLIQTNYKEFMNCFQFIEEQTPFSTKHGTKGNEFDNVLVIIDDKAWKQKYNFKAYFENTESNINRLERTRNLFYVCCSRAKEDLAILALSDMSSAMGTINNWFGSSNVFTVKDLNGHP